MISFVQPSSVPNLHFPCLFTVLGRGINYPASIQFGYQFSLLLISACPLCEIDSVWLLILIIFFSSLRTVLYSFPKNRFIRSIFASVFHFSLLVFSFYPLSGLWSDRFRELISVVFEFCLSAVIRPLSFDLWNFCRSSPASLPTLVFKLSVQCLGSLQLKGIEDRWSCLYSVQISSDLIFIVMNIVSVSLSHPGIESVRFFCSVFVRFCSASFGSRRLYLASFGSGLSCSASFASV